MASKPSGFDMPDAAYAGDVTAQDAWEALAKIPAAVLVDVRTQVEWTLVGKPDLSSLGKEQIDIQWVTMQGPNKNFVQELKEALEARDVATDAPVYFLCQSGGRSKIAAQQCTKLGYTQAFNVAEGMEGDLDEHKHRNSVSGWKVAGLPWTQT